MQPTNVINLSDHRSPQPQEEVPKNDPRRNWGSISPITESEEAHVEVTNKDGIVKIEITDEEEVARRQRAMEERDNRTEAEKKEIMEAL